MKRTRKILLCGAVALLLGLLLCLLAGCGKDAPEGKKENEDPSAPGENEDDKPGDEKDPEKDPGTHTHVYEDDGDMLYCAECGDTKLPVISIRTDGKPITDDYSSCTVTVSGTEKQSFADAKAKIKVRGNGTASLPKKPYRIKFESKQKMLGLNDGLKAKSWVLLAEYNDKSMMKNATAFALGEAILGTDGYYVTDCRFVTVELDGKYQGVYLLAEQQQVDEGRVAVPEPEDDYTGTDIGYLVELDHYYTSEEYAFTLSYQNLISEDGRTVDTGWFEPGYTVKNDVTDPSQVAYIKKFVQGVWDVLYDAAYRDHTASPYKTLDADANVIPAPWIRSAKEAAEAVADIDSLVDTYLLQELCENMDVGYSSFYFSVDCSATGDRRLTFEAPWDFDWGLGDRGYCKEGFYSSNPTNPYIRHANPWLIVLARQEWFTDMVGARWRDVETDAGDAIDEMEELSYTLSGEFLKNFSRWSDCLTYEEPNHRSEEYSAARTQSAASAWLFEFLNARFDFLHKTFTD